MADERGNGPLSGSDPQTQRRRQNRISYNPRVSPLIRSKKRTCKLQEKGCYASFLCSPHKKGAIFTGDEQEAVRESKCISLSVCVLSLRGSTYVGHREGQRPNEGRSTGPNRDRRSHKMGRTGLSPTSVRSSLGLRSWTEGRNPVFPHPAFPHSCIPHF